MNVLQRFLNLISALGAINWALVTLFQFNMVEYACDYFGKHMWDRYVYIAIGVAGLFTLMSIFRD